MDIVPREITKGVYLIGSAGAQDKAGCNVYLLDFGEPVLIDAGTGKSFPHIVANIEALGFNPADIGTVILTHCHVDHTAGALRFKQRFACRLIMHELDAQVVEKGDNQLSGGNWFKISLSPTPIDIKLSGELNVLRFNGQELNCLHTPGHSPGSLSLYADVAGKRILFGQDIHAPILKEYHCDAYAWQRSMQKLLALKADILCEGHMGIFEPAEEVDKFIEKYISVHLAQER